MNLFDCPILPVELNEIPHFVPLAALSTRNGKIADLFPHGFGISYFDWSSLATTRDGIEVRCIGKVYQYFGSLENDFYYCYEYVPTQELQLPTRLVKPGEKVFFLLNDSESNELRSEENPTYLEIEN